MRIAVMPPGNEWRLWEVVVSSLLTSILALIVTLGVLISFHEFGHFWVARRLGVKVLRFSVGFGKPLWLRRSPVDGTEYVIAAIPLGGYVKMLDEREEEVASDELHRAFNRQSVWRRIAIVVAGPMFNFLFAIAAYSLLFMIGVVGLKPLLGPVTPGSIAEQGGFQEGDLIVAVAERPTATSQAALLALVDLSMAEALIQVQVRDQDQRLLSRTLDLRGHPGLAEDGDLLNNLGLTRPALPAIIDQVSPDGAAEHAGLQAGDRILAADGVVIQGWRQWVNVVRARPEQTFSVRVQRNGETQIISLTPKALETEVGVIGRIGASPRVPAGYLESLQVVIRYGAFDAVLKGAVKTWDMSLFTLRMFGRMLMGQASLKNISGPITIAQYAGETASMGWSQFLTFLALVSISLGVLNLLPVPILDGGHLLYYLIEVAKGSPLSDSAQNVGQHLGIILLVMLMGLAFFNDFTRLWG